MSYYAFKNNLKATLHYDMTDTDTVIWLKQLVTSTDPDTRLAAWPTCDASHTFTLTLESIEDSKIREIVECTGVTANTTDYIAFSCARAKENTVAIAHNKNATNVENRITAAALTTIVDALTTTAASVTANTTSISTITSSVNALSSTLAGKANNDLSNATVLPQTILKAALSASGSAPMYACRGWANINGMNTAALRAGGNVSSIVDNSVGDFSVNWAVPMPDDKYVTNVTAMRQQDGAQTIISSIKNISGGYSAVSTTSVRVQLTNYDGGALDGQVFIAAFR